MYRLQTYCKYKSPKFLRGHISTTQDNSSTLTCIPIYIMIRPTPPIIVQVLRGHRGPPGHCRGPPGPGPSVDRRIDRALTRREPATTTVYLSHRHGRSSAGMVVARCWMPLVLALCRQPRVDWDTGAGTPVVVQCWGVLELGSWDLPR